MKRFRFNLEQLLRLKHWREEEAKKALAEEVAALEKLKAHLFDMQGDMNDVLLSHQGMEEGQRVDYQGRMGILQYARHLGEQMLAKHEEIATQGERLKEKSDLLLKAMQERKVLEKLKEKRLLEHRAEVGKGQYANLDEASAGFLRRAAAAREAEEEIET